MLLMNHENKAKSLYVPKSCPTHANTLCGTKQRIISYMCDLKTGQYKYAMGEAKIFRVILKCCTHRTANQKAAQTVCGDQGKKQCP